MTHNSSYHISKGDDVKVSAREVIDRSGEIEGFYVVQVDTMQKWMTEAGLSFDPYPLQIYLDNGMVFDRFIVDLMAEHKRLRPQNHRALFGQTAAPESQSPSLLMSAKEKIASLVPGKSAEQKNAEALERAKSCGYEPVDKRGELMDVLRDIADSTVKSIKGGA